MGAKGGARGLLPASLRFTAKEQGVTGWTMTETTEKKGPKRAVSWRLTERTSLEDSKWVRQRRNGRKGRKYARTRRTPAGRSAALAKLVRDHTQSTLQYTDSLNSSRLVQPNGEDIDIYIDVFSGAFQCKFVDCFMPQIKCTIKRQKKIDTFTYNKQLPLSILLMSGGLQLSRAAVSRKILNQLN